MKNYRKFCAAVLAATVFTGMSSAFAVQGQTNEQQDPMQEKYILQGKWDALTDRQRRAVYKLFTRKGKSEIALMDEYADLGLITEDEAEAYEERVEDWLEALEESGEVPPIFGRARNRARRTTE